MKASLGLMAVTTVLLAGCANYEYLQDEYGQTPMQLFEFRGTTYRLWDKAAQNKIMVGSNLGAAAGDGFIKGLTFGVVNPAPGEPTLHAVAEAYVTSTNRSCEVAPGSLVAEPQWEFRYKCAAPLATAKP